ncbi:hypothetical protein CL654_02860 [bacterium]|nr:hypothetical protein [bacterium]|tara:strand:- start:22119 stop:22775 length:657 start_codon:yes stop_codon:yes gene_type:complete
MKISILKIEDKVKEFYHKFHKKEGSDEIAAPATLQKLLNIIRRESVHSILEFGAGIGTITKFLLDNTSAHVTAYEHNPFCIQKMKENTNNDPRLTLITNPKEVVSGEYDLVVIDGGDIETIGNVLQGISPKHVVFEGYRWDAQRIVLNSVKGKRSISYEKLVDPDGGKGGYVMHLGEGRGGYTSARISLFNELRRKRGFYKLVRSSLKKLIRKHKKGN